MYLLRYIRAHPFSVMALCNITGDLGYLGFAFAAQGWVSLPKLAGARFTMVAHVVLLAHGDDQARRIAHENGLAARVILKLRACATGAFMFLPERARSSIRAKPVGIAFAILSLNGAGLLIDALNMPFSAAGAAQDFLGAFIIAGCGAFAAADFTPSQRVADILLRIAPVFLTAASFCNAALVVTTHNVFLLAALLVFLLSNLTGFYARIDKKEPVSAGI